MSADPDVGGSSTRRGSCLCGGVRYTVDAPLRDVWACHCRRCQKTSGNHVAATAAPARAISFDDDETLRWHHPADDSNVAYGFCGECGSSLFYRVADDATVSIMAGTLDGPTGLRTTEVWFAANAAEHALLHPEARHHPGEPAG